MKPQELIIAGLIALGAIIVSSIGYIAENIKTGIPSLDRWEIRYRLAFWCFRTFGAQAITNPNLPRALMAIVHNESIGLPKFYLGDTTASGGPSIGPMQIYRRTAIDLKLWTPPQGMTEAEQRKAYAELAQNESMGIRWGVAVFADKLRIAKGNIPEAVRRYNGSGALAEKYQAKALAFANEKWGALT